MARLPLALAAPALALLALATRLDAQGWIDIERSPVRAGGPVTRVSSSVKISLEDRVAHIEVEERFRNTGGSVAEGSYLYPLPGEAVFQNFSLWNGGREMRGEVMTADQARGIYEEIVRRRKDPALLTLAGHGLVRAQVFPIEPGETRRVVLRYTQLLERAGDALRLRYAMGDRGATADPASVLVSLPGTPAFGTPYSPTHPLTTRRNGDHTDVTVDATAGGDVELFLPLRQGLVGTTVVAHAPGGEDGYYMLLLSPPPASSATALPRDLTLVVDVSGSMSGAKLEQARAALLQALGTLAPTDRFRLIAFSSAVRPFRAEPVAATRENIAAARAFVGALNADGGTNIEGALDAALAAPPAEGHLGIVVFMTDGLPSVGEQAPDRLADRTAARLGNLRVFTVGIGHDINTYLLDRLAVEGRGNATYIAPDGSVEVAMSSLLTKLRFPALVDLRVVTAPVRLGDASPGRLPDLFYGEELVVLGRYHGAGSGALVIEGERNGRRERFTANVRFPESSARNDFIPRLWASRRVGDLTRQIRLEGANAGLIEQVRELGLRYGILTDYTSYLVQEPGALADGNRRLRDDRAMPAAAPAAQNGRAAFAAASRSAQMSAATNVASAEKSASADYEAAGPDVRRGGGRVFVRRNDVWTDMAHRDSLHVTTVTPFSPAYFALVRALPEIAQCLAVGDRVIVAGRRVSIAVGPGGTSEWRGSELAALVSSYRGT